MVTNVFVLRKLLLAMSMIGCLIAGLVYAGVKGSSQSVVTVHDLLQSGEARERVRLGGRVTDEEVIFKTEPDLLVSFAVTDPGADLAYRVESSAVQSIKVHYRGVMPNTLKTGRDVILEGRFDGREFEAKTLLTQCPSKYEPPEYGQSDAGKSLNFGNTLNM